MMNRTMQMRIMPRGRLILLFAVLLVLSCSLAFGLRVWSGVTGVVQAVRSEYGASFVVKLPSYITNNTGYYRDELCSDGVRRRFYVGPPMTDDMIRTLAGQLDGITGWNASLQQNVNVKDIQLIAGMGSFFFRESYGIDTVAYGSTSTALYHEFLTGSFTLTEGRHITADDRYKVLISDELAQHNGLKIGDSFTISGKKWNSFPFVEREPLTLEIVGIFHANGGQQTGELIHEIDICYNWLLTDAQTVKTLQQEEDGAQYASFPTEAQYESVTFYFDDPAQMQDALDQLGWIEGFQINDYEITPDATLYQPTVDPLCSIRNQAVAAALLMAAVCMALLCLLFIRQLRQNGGETVRAAGSRACLAAFGRVMCSAIPAALIAFVLAAALTGPAAEQLGNRMLDAAVSSTEREASDSTEVIQYPMRGSGYYSYYRPYEGPEHIDFSAGPATFAALAALELLAVAASAGAGVCTVVLGKQ